MDYTDLSINLKDNMIFKQPVYAWKCQLIYGTYWHVEEGKQPNWFHRMMQRLCFGIKWERLK